MSLLTDLIGYWKCDEASGNLLDAHGSNDLTETSGTIAAATGVLGGGRDMEADDTEYFTHASNSDLSFGDIAFTIQIWIKAESNVGTRTILSKWNTGGSESSFRLRHSASNQLNYQIAGSGTSFERTIYFATPIGSWLQVLIDHDPVGNTIGWRINGGSRSTVSTSIGLNAGTADFRVGHAVTGFDGVVDEIGFWKRLLTDDEAAALYNSGSGLAYPLTTTENFDADLSSEAEADSSFACVITKAATISAASLADANFATQFAALAQFAAAALGSESADARADLEAAFHLSSAASAAADGTSHRQAAVSEAAAAAVAIGGAKAMAGDCTIAASAGDTCAAATSGYAAVAAGCVAADVAMPRTAAAAEISSTAAANATHAAATTHRVALAAHAAAGDGLLVAIGTRVLAAATAGSTFAEALPPPNIDLTLSVASLRRFTCAAPALRTLPLDVAACRRLRLLVQASRDA